LSLLLTASFSANIARSQGQDQKAPASKHLKERRVTAKPAKTTVRDTERSDVIVVKFREGTGIRLRSNRLAAGASSRSAGEQKLLERNNLDQINVERDLDQVHLLFQSNRDIHIERLFERPEEALDSQKAEGESNTGDELADLNLYYQLKLGKADSTRAGQLIDELNSLDAVEIAYPQPVMVPMQADLPPETQNFTDNQGYLNAAPNGIDARFAWTQAGGRGAGLRIIATCWSRSPSKNSGTALIGISVSSGADGVTARSAHFRSFELAFERVHNLFSSLILSRTFRA
jgi:hypothetical protein